MFVNIISSSRLVVAACDKDLIGKIFEQNTNINKIEIKIKDLINLNLLDIEQQLGIFGRRDSYPHFHEFPLILFFLLGYPFSIVTGTYFIWIQNKLHGMIILAVYLIVSVFLVFFVYPGIKYIIRQRKDI